MARAVRMLNKYEYKTLLLEGNPQWENFYKDELIGFLQVAKELLKEYKKKAAANNKSTEFIKSLIKPKRQDTSFHRNPIYIAEMINLLEILGDKENDN